MILLHFNHCRRHRICSPLGTWYIRGVIKRLKLNETQKAKFLSLQDNLNASESHVGEIEQERNAMLNEVFTGDTFDKNAALQLMNIPQRAFAEQVPAVVDSFAEFYESLDNHQREKVRELCAEYASAHRDTCH